MGDLYKPAGRDAKIAAGQVESTAVQLDHDTLIGLLTQAALVGTSLSFRVSHDGATFVPLHKPEDGALYSVAVAPSRAVPLEAWRFMAWRFVKVVSNAAGPGFETVATAVTLLSRPLA